MRRSIWQVRIPTVFGLLVLIAGVFVTSFLVKTGVIVIGNASPSEVPQDVRITNVSDTSFSVSYKTDARVIGTISFGSDKNLGKVGIDDRDQATGTVNPYTIHYITIKNLSQNTAYFFSIQSGGTTYLHDNTPFQITTAQVIQAAPLNQPPIIGKAVQNDGSPPAEGIVYLKAPSSQPLSAILKNDGSYIIPIQTLRSDNLAAYASLSPKTVLDLLIVADKGNTTVSLFASQGNPVPLVTILQNYDFTSSSQSLSTPIASESANLHFPTVLAKEATSKDPDIATPKKDQQVLDQQPQFKGSAPAGSNVKIIIHSDQTIQGQATADANGNWNFRPKEQLSPGKHTISIIAPDRFGVLKTITQSFTVYAAGNQVSESATPSATPTIALPSATPIPTSTPTPFVQQVVTQVPTPTTPLLLLTPTIAIQKGGSPLPKVGNELLIVFGSFSLGIFLFSILLFIATRKKTFV